MTHRHTTLLPGLALIAATGLAQAATPPAEITVPGERIFPESLTSSHDGSVIIGSIGTHQIFRARPGSDKAEPWIKPDTDGMQSIFGVFADDKSKTLYACSNPPFGPPVPGATPGVGTLYSFDLKTGATKGHYPFPTARAACNDIAVGADGTVYATDTTNEVIVTLKKGAGELTVWTGTQGEVGEKGSVLDGIAVLGKRVIAGTLRTGKLYSIPIQSDGSAGAVTEVKLDRALEGPDGIRSFGPQTLLVVEGGGGGHLTEVKLSGDSGTTTELKKGYPDGATAVTVVGNTAYVVESQLMRMMRPPNAQGPAPEPKPFHATAVDLGKP